MLCKAVLLILLVFAIGAQASEEVSRKDAKAQRGLRAGSFAPLRLCGKPSENNQARDLTIEVFQVIGLPLAYCAARAESSRCPDETAHNFRR
jgi:hypothetical protein